MAVKGMKYGLVFCCKTPPRNWWLAEDKGVRCVDFFLPHILTL